MEASSRCLSVCLSVVSGSSFFFLPAPACSRRRGYLSFGKILLSSLLSPPPWHCGLYLSISHFNSPLGRAPLLHPLCRSLPLGDFPLFRVLFTYILPPPPHTHHLPKTPAITTTTTTTPGALYLAHHPQLPSYVDHHHINTSSHQPIIYQASRPGGIPIPPP
jgi:hypothetical protein